jgi:hypothetical protein
LRRTTAIGCSTPLRRAVPLENAQTLGPLDQRWISSVKRPDGEGTISRLVAVAVSEHSSTVRRFATYHRGCMRVEA